MGAALKFKQTAVPRQRGETARAKVVRGPDYGAVYVFTGAVVSVGRGEENDIVISDLKASRRHAEFGATAQGWAVRDLGSANGIVVNGKATRSSPLVTKDTIALGETVLEFIAPEAGTMLLLAPARTIEEVQVDQIALAEQKKKVQSIGKFGRAAAPAAPGAPKPAADKRMLLYGGGAALLAVLYFMSGGDEPSGDAAKSKKKSAKEKIEKVTTLDDLAKFLPGNEPGPIARTADTFFRTGFREYKSKNYLRAKTQFETVLQMIPGHPLAVRYLDAVAKEIQDEADQRLNAGKSCLKAGKFRDARGHFEAVLRLLFWNPTDIKYVQAKESLKEVEVERLRDTPNEMPSSESGGRN